MPEPIADVVEEISEPVIESIEETPLEPVIETIEETPEPEVESEPVTEIPIPEEESEQVPPSNNFETQLEDESAEVPLGKYLNIILFCIRTVFV